MARIALAAKVRSVGALSSKANFVAISCSQPLAQTQIYPFHLYATQIRNRYGATLCEIDSDDFVRTSAGTVTRRSSGSPSRPGSI
jgi:hypothetical protein